MEVREKIYDLAVERNDDGSVPAILIALAGDKDYAFVLSRYHTVNFAVSTSSIANSSPPWTQLDTLHFYLISIFVDISTSTREHQKLIILIEELGYFLQR